MTEYQCIARLNVLQQIAENFTHFLEIGVSAFGARDIGLGSDDIQVKSFAVLLARILKCAATYPMIVFVDVFRAEYQQRVQFIDAGRL